MDPTMDPKKRLHLNFGVLGGGGAAAGAGYNGDQNYTPGNERIFPTTPSTFPQSVFQGSHPANEYVGAQVQRNVYGGQQGGYFPTGAYQAQYSSPQSPYQQNQGQFQGQYQNQQYQQQNLAAPQPSYQQRTGYNANDPTSGLARQFSNQNLGTPQRQASPLNRQPSPNARLYGAGQPIQGQQNRNQQSYMSNQQNQSSLLTPTDSSVQSLSATTEEPPEKTAQKFSGNVIKRGHGLHALVEAFFKENITRARDRNIRARALEEVLRREDKTEQEKQIEAQHVRNNENQYLRFLRTKETPANFMTIAKVGKGAFGEVKLVRRKRDNKIYALKSLVKTEMFKKDQLAHVRAERDILAESDSPWVVKLHTTFQDNTYLYMLMEFLPGGDLMTMLIKYEIFSLPITRFYMAEIVLAIEAVHTHGYIHRDIKPDNILLDRGGHVKLTDFGLSTGFRKQHDNAYYQSLLKGSSNKEKNRNSVNFDQINLTINDRRSIANTWRKSARRILAYSTVGTPDYIAPEIFGGQGYSFACDWWSVGAIMFECLVGWPPFCAEDAHDTYRKIVNWRQTLYFPEENPLLDDEQGKHQWPDAERCIRAMLCDVSDRLGGHHGQNGAQEIKAHPFFRGVAWDQLRRIRAPFEPNLQSAVDVSYFPVNEIPQDDTSGKERAAVDALGDEHSADIALPFIGYTFKRFEGMRT